MRRNCGNKIVEDDEECDCGSFEECEQDSCCDSITCKLKVEAECAAGMCCENCKVRKQRERIFPKLTLKRFVCIFICLQSIS